MVAAAWLVGGCKDNPGFALLPDRPGEETSSGSTTDAPPGTTTTTDTSGDESTTDDPPPVTEGSTSTIEPPDTTDTTGGPSLCGNGVMDDPGELCDDANTTPHDKCEANCRPLFDSEIDLGIDDQCSALVAADFDGDGRHDLAVATPLKIRVLENGAEFVFIDNGHSFSHGGVPGTMFARNLDDKARPDTISLQPNINVCRNAEPFADNYCNNEDVQSFAAPDLGGLIASTLHLADATGDGKLDAIFANQASDTIGVFPGREDPTIFGELIERPIPPMVAGQVTAIAPAFIGGGPGLDLVVAHNVAMDADSHVTVILDFNTANNSTTLPVPIGDPVTSLDVADLGLGGDLPVIVAAAPSDKRLFVLGGTSMAGYSVLGDGILAGPSPSKVLAARLRGGDTWDLVSFDREGSSVRIAPVDGFLPPNAAEYPVAAEGLVDITLVDLDNDDDLEVVALGADCTISILPNLTNIK